eukprot:TRINITY_DN84243_c0_g1_i1.p3 TRINITY_DN84243_c0_g1~~TRINITY_DN84243_c0_g1_i1.p3  ORF type:complete len:105 (+),score=11.80 TRINITY_DN84243_c0_g1_i1:300-614(+)
MKLIELDQEVVGIFKKKKNNKQINKKLLKIDQKIFVEGFCKCLTVNYKLNSQSLFFFFFFINSVVNMKLSQVRQSWVIQKNKKNKQKKQLKLTSKFSWKIFVNI